MNVRTLVFAFLVLISCKQDKSPRTRDEFCADWAAAACSDEVVSVCQAASADACRSSQEDFCRSLVPSKFSDNNGDACIAAVKNAYKDADLSASELATVLRLATPCDSLIVGPKAEGDSCTQQSDCDVSAHLQCVFKSTSPTGSCEVPVEVGGGRNCQATERTCETGFYCDGSNCIEAKSAGDDCTIQAECGEAGFCGDDGKCAERLATDATCTDDFQCRIGICYEFQGNKVCTDRIRLARTDPLCANFR